VGERVDGVLGEGARDNKADARLVRGGLGIRIARRDGRKESDRLEMEMRR
jgi:hypothetical protein